MLDDLCPLAALTILPQIPSALRIEINAAAVRCKLLDRNIDPSGVVADHFQLSRICAEEIMQGALTARNFQFIVAVLLTLEIHHSHECNDEDNKVSKP